MKKIIKFTEDYGTRRRIMRVIWKHTPQLVQDPYGNYVLQESLDNWHDTDPELHDDNEKCFFANLFKNIEGKIERLAIQKFSSNVIEKCLERSNEHYRRIFVKEILNGEPVAVMKNSYGNYVFQKALALAKGIDKFKIIDIIFRNFPTIQDQKIKMKWIKLLKKNLKQEDVLEADAEQDTLSLEIDEMINYSHKFKLINDELTRYDAGQSKKDTKTKNVKKKPSSIAETNYSSSYSAGLPMSYPQHYPSNMYYQNTMHASSPMVPGPSYDSMNGQYQLNFQSPHTIPPSYHSSMHPSYGYQPMSQDYPAQSDPSAVTQEQYYYGQGKKHELGGRFKQ